MSSNFVYEGRSKTFNVANLKPAMVARYFKLDESTIMMTDDEDNAYLAENGRFDPPLEANKTYTVEGEARLGSSVVSASVAGSVYGDEEMNARGPSMQVATRNHDQGLTMNTVSANIEQVVDHYASLYQNINMVYSALRTVGLMEAVAVLASCQQDASLVTANMPAGSFVYLKNPNSFRASLYELTSSIMVSFRVSNNSMRSIKAALSGLPNNFTDLMQLMGSPQTEKVANTIKYTYECIDRSANKCVQKVEETLDSLNGVMELIKELCHASISAQSFNEETVKKLKDTVAQIEIQKQARAQEAQRLEQERQENRKILDQVQKDFFEQLKKPVPSARVYQKRGFFGFFRSTHIDNSPILEHERTTQRLSAEYQQNRVKDENFHQMMEQKHREMADFMCRLKGMNMQHAELNEIIALLQTGIGIISQIQGEWTTIINFFDNVKMVIEEYLMDTLNNCRVHGANDALDYLAREGIKLVAISVQMMNVADIYSLIMDRHVMPQLGSIGKELALTVDDAKTKINDVATRYLEKEQKMVQVIDEKKKEYFIKAMGQTKNYAMDIHEAYTVTRANRLENMEQFMLNNM